MLDSMTSSDILNAQLNTRGVDGFTSTQGDRAQAYPVQVDQYTLKSELSFEGVGVHSGDVVRVTLKPADVNTGIVFKRIDVASDNNDERDSIVLANYDNVRDTRLCTKLINDDGVAVATVEHLMAALAAMGIDNVLIEMNGEEMPIMDGSSEPFMVQMEYTGIQVQSTPRRAIRILKEIAIQGDNGEIAKLSPTDTHHMTISARIDFDSAVIGSQQMSIPISKDTFKNQLATARTFGFVRDIEKLRQVGLARGGSFDNAIVVDEDRVLNPTGLRFDDEFIRHKILDAVGDLYLAGAPIIGNYYGERLGHAMNNKILHALFADETAYEWIDMDAPLGDSPSTLKKPA